MPTKHAKPRPSEGEPTKDGPPAGKPGQTARQRGVDIAKLKVVAELMAGGMDYYEMQVTLSQRWGVSMRTIRNWRDRVLRDMSEQLEDAGFMDPGLEKVLGVSRLDHIYLAAMAAKDLRTALGAVKTRMLVAGVLTPERQEHVITIQPTLPAQLQPDEDPNLAAKRVLAQRLARTLIGDATLVHQPAAVTKPVAAAAKGGR